MGNNKLRSRKITENETNEFHVIVNDAGEFLYHIYENEGAHFTKKIKYAEEFTECRKGILKVPKFYKYIDNVKVKDIYHLAELIGGKLVKVEAEKISVTTFNFKQ